MDVENEDALIERLHRRDAVPLNINIVNAPPKRSSFFEKLKIGIKRTTNPIRLHEILMFTHQLSAMFSSGIPLSRSLQSIAIDSKNKHLQEIITEIYRSIEAGEDLSQAMSRYPEVFDELYVNLIRSGEISGTLAIVLPQLVSYIERYLEVRGKVKAAITYPFVIISFAILVIAFLVLIIVPKFGIIYNRLKAPLPLPTKILLTGSQLIRQNFFAMIFLSLMILFLLYLCFQTERIEFLWDRAKLRIPIFGPLVLKSIFAKFCKTLSVLLQSGLPIIQSIQIASNTLNNRYLQHVLEKCNLSIQKGASISEAFAESSAFPDLLIQMVSSGEESGTLHIMLEKTSNFYQQQVNSTVNALTSIIEPILIIIIGVIVAGIAIAVFLPIFKMGEAL